MTSIPDDEPDSPVRQFQRKLMKYVDGQLPAAK